MKLKLTVMVNNYTIMKNANNLISPRAFEGPCGSISQIVGLPNNSCKSITNTALVRTRLCKLQKGCTRLASYKVYQLLAHGRWFSPDTPTSSTTKTGCHDIVEILLKMTLNTINQIKSNRTFEHTKTMTYDKLQ